MPSVLNFNRSYLRTLCVGKVHLLKRSGGCTKARKKKKKNGILVFVRK